MLRYDGYWRYCGHMRKQHWLLCFSHYTAYLLIQPVRLIEEELDLLSCSAPHTASPSSTALGFKFERMRFSLAASADKGTLMPAKISAFALFLSPLHTGRTLLALWLPLAQLAAIFGMLEPTLASSSRLQLMIPNPQCQLQPPTQDPGAGFHSLSRLYLLIVIAV